MQNRAPAPRSYGKYPQNNNNNNNNFQAPAPKSSVGNNNDDNNNNDNSMTAPPPHTQQPQGQGQLPPYMSFREQRQAERDAMRADTVCRFWTKIGGCQKGSDCPFRHPDGDDAKLEVCKYYLSSRGCNKGNSCPYYHELSTHSVAAVVGNASGDESMESLNSPNNNDIGGGGENAAAAASSSAAASSGGATTQNESAADYKVNTIKPDAKTIASTVKQHSAAASTSYNASTGLPNDGSQMSITTNAGIHYEGILDRIDMKENHIHLRSACRIGDEETEKYDSITFRGGDIKEMLVFEVVDM